MPNPDKNRGRGEEPRESQLIGKSRPKITPEIAAEIESEMKHTIQETGEDQFIKES